LTIYGVKKLNNLLYRLFLTFTIWTPIWAWFIYQTPLKGWKWYLSTVPIYALTVYAAYNPARIQGLTNWLHYYGFYLLLYILLVGYRKGWTDFNRVLGMGLFITFIAGELWEVPIFIYDALGKLGVLNNQWSGSVFNYPWFESHVRRLYTLGSAILFIKTANVNGRLILSIMALTVVTSFVTLAPFMFQYPSELLLGFSTSARVFSLALCGYGLYEAVLHE